MATDKVTWLMTIKLPSGQPICSFLMESELVGEPPAPLGNSAPVAPVQGQAKAEAKAPGNDNEEKMTEPQKRYLFRLLAAQGIEGKSAEEHIKGYFKVAFLKDVPKLAASSYIDQLVNGRKEG